MVALGQHKCSFCQKAGGDGHGHCWCCGARTQDAFDLKTGTPREDGHPVPDGALEIDGHAICPNGCPISGDEDLSGACSVSTCVDMKASKIAARASAKISKSV